MRVEQPAAWSAPQRWLHWTIAGLIAAALPLAWAMVAVPFRQLLLKFALYQAHKTVGLSVLMLTLIQITLHVVRGRPPREAGGAPWQRKAATATHAMLFALLLITPILGYLTAAAAPVHIPTLLFGVLAIPHIIGPNAALFAVLRPLHLGMALTLAVLASGHVTMAVWHHLQGRPTLRRMRSGSQSAP